MQDELATLFSRNLNLNPLPSSSIHTPSEAVATPMVTEEPISYSISQHYHHSAHLASSTKPSSNATPAFDADSTDQQTAEIILSRHGVDPSTLFPFQLL